METEGPSSSPAPEPPRDGDAPTSETTREDLERRLRLSESVALELERALEGKCRSLDESTRAAESLRRELRAARAANEADGSVPAAAMDAARAEIERLRAALVDGERERAALKSLASKATNTIPGAEGGRDGGDERDATMNGDVGDARLRAAVAEERLAMAERALAEWREYASALEERCAAAEAAAADALRDARSASIRAGTETRAKALASAAGARATRHEHPERGSREEDGEGPVPPPVPAQSRPPPPPPPYASEPSRVAFQRARVANGELAAALAAARSVARAAEEASTRAASALARASSLRARVDDGMGARGEPKARVGKDVAAAYAEPPPPVTLPSVAEWAAAAAGRTASGEAFEARDGDWDSGDAMRVDWAKAAAAVAGEEGKEEGDEGKEEGDEGKEGGDGVDWVAKAAESRRAWAERRARGDIDPTLEKIASEY